ncbi:MAG: zinc ribbon domain-containing protein [Terriglobales bacterium]
MEHPCYKCGANVEDGVPFCTQCNAPQIRVGGSNPEAGSAAELSEASFPVFSGASIQWSDGVPAAALAGLVAALLMFIALGVFGLGLIGCGALSVVLYRRRNPLSDLSPGMGARLGAVSGIFGFGIFAILSAVGMLAFRSGVEMRNALLDAIAQSAARSPDAQVQKAFEYLKTPPGLALMMALSLAVLLVAFLVLSSIGGAVGAAMMRRKDRM